MGEFQEIVDASMVGRLFVLMAIVGPILGIGLGAMLGVRKKATYRGALQGLVVGLLGPLNWLLWKIYDALTDRNGLDSVRNLEINVALFVAVGAVMGVGIGLWQRRNASRMEGKGET